MLSIRWLLARENRLRDAEPVDETYDDVYIEVVTPEGKRVEKKVSKVGFHLCRCVYGQWLMLRCALGRNSWTLRIGRTGISVTCCNYHFRVWVGLTSLYVEGQYCTSRVELCLSLLLLNYYELSSPPVRQCVNSIIDKRSS